MIRLRRFVLARQRGEPGNWTSPRWHYEPDIGRGCSSCSIKGNHIAIYPLPTRRVFRNVHLCRHRALSHFCSGWHLRNGSFSRTYIAPNNTLITNKTSTSGEEYRVSSWCQYNYAVCRRRLPSLKLGLRSTFKGTEHANMNRVLVIAKPSVWNRPAIWLLSMHK
jgi:hypothetical protein